METYQHSTYAWAGYNNRSDGPRKEPRNEHEDYTDGARDCARRAPSNHPAWNYAGRQTKTSAQLHPLLGYRAELVRRTSTDGAARKLWNSDSRDHKCRKSAALLLQPRKHLQHFLQNLGNR